MSCAPRARALASSSPSRLTTRAPSVGARPVWPLGGATATKRRARGRGRGGRDRPAPGQEVVHGRAVARRPREGGLDPGGDLGWGAGAALRAAEPGRVLRRDVVVDLARRDL